MSSYRPDIIEPKWQKRWEEDKAYLADRGKNLPKLYVLDMFPYPSGDGLHVGHSRIYTASDLVTRAKILQGYRVLHPTGWDAFGLPAENYAIKTGIHPSVATAKNIANAKRQMQLQGFMYDWSREINTTDPNYYHWTQWIFLQLFKHNLAYEADVPINWCPSCKTGLANEEVIGGRCDRCGSKVEKKQLSQWMLKITAYADRLLGGLANLDWPVSIKKMQENWIGKSNGANVRFMVVGRSEEIVVFTTRPDTLFGATYLVLAPEHPLVDLLTTKDHLTEMLVYRKSVANKTDSERIEGAGNKEKTGIFTGSFAVNPVNGEHLPIWVADYVLSNYGTGAIMAVPAHDQRDLEFAKKFKLPVTKVIFSSTPITTEAYLEDGLLINSGRFNGLTVAEAKKAIVEDLETRGLAEPQTVYRLRDWVFSRQRYWGEPIPLIHCPKCGIVPVPDNELPLVLPEVEKYQPTGTGQSPLAAIAKWVNTSCPKCGGRAKRETNTMPQWAGSSWYFLRFTDPHNNRALADQPSLDAWMPVDLYLGGAEHAVLHLLYARFWQMFLYDIGVVKQEEPFKQLKSVGLILTNTYRDQDGHYIHYDDLVLDGDTVFDKRNGHVLTAEVEKMSKSKGNSISPDSIITRYGSDTLRVYLMFLGPWHEMSVFDLNGIEGSFRFLKKVYFLADKVSQDCQSSDDRLLNQTIDKVTKDIDLFQFNTAVSQLMILVNAWQKETAVSADRFSVFLQLLFPFAPHLAEELWQKIGHNESIFASKWPEAKIGFADDTRAEIAVQVDSKLRGKISVSQEMTAEQITELVLSDEKIGRFVTSRQPKAIYVKGHLINLLNR